MQEQREVITLRDIVCRNLTTNEYEMVFASVLIDSAETAVSMYEERTDEEGKQVILNFMNECLWWADIHLNNIYDEADRREKRMKECLYESLSKIQAYVKSVTEKKAA